MGIDLPKQDEKEVKKIIGDEITPEEAVKLQNLIDRASTKTTITVDENTSFKDGKSNLLTVTEEKVDVNNVFKQYKEKIVDGIIKFFNIQDIKNPVINKDLKPEEKKAYINIIEGLELSKAGKDHENLFIAAINWALKWTPSKITDIPTSDKQPAIDLNPQAVFNDIVAQAKKMAVPEPQKPAVAKEKTRGPSPEANPVKDKWWDNQKPATDKDNPENNKQQKTEGEKGGKDPENKPEQPADNKKKSEEEQKTPPTEEQEKAAKENAEAIQNKLNGILLATNPTEEQVNALFWADATYKEARNLLFNDATLKSPIENTKDKTPTGKEKQFLHLVAIWCTKGKEEEVTKIELKKADKRYTENYIVVTLKDWQTREILFTKQTDENYSKRAATFDIETEFTKWKDLGEDIVNLNANWSYRTFEKIINDPTKKIDLTKLLIDNPTAVFDTINKFHNDAKKTIDDSKTKENGYYNVITDYVVKYTKENMKTPEWLLLLQAYLKGANAQNIKYLGTDSVAQIYNYNKLVDLVNGPNFPQDRPISKEIRTSVKAIESQLKATAPANFQEAAKQSLTEARNKYGKDIVAILSFFWGKWFAKKILGKYYDKYKDQIDKKYEEKYSLSTEEKAQVRKITTWMDQSILFDDVTKDSDWAYFKKQFNEKAKVADYSTELIKEESYKLIDPNVVYKAVEAHNKKEENKNDQKDRKSYLTKNDKWAYEITTTVDATTKKEVADIILEDDATWTAIARANNQITGDLPTGGKVEDKSRFDLDQPKRDLYKINTVKDIGIALTSYAFAGSNNLDYVITETKLDPDVRQSKAKAPEKKETEQKVTFVKDMADEKWVITAAGWAKKIHEVIDMSTPPDEIKITRADGKTIIEATLESNLKEGDITFDKTYIIKNSNPKERVKIAEKDKIEAKQPEK